MSLFLLGYKARPRATGEPTGILALLSRSRKLKVTDLRPFTTAKAADGRGGNAANRLIEPAAPRMAVTHRVSQLCIAGMAKKGHIRWRARKMRDEHDAQPR